MKTKYQILLLVIGIFLLGLFFYLTTPHTTVTITDLPPITKPAIMIS